MTRDSEIDVLDKRFPIRVTMPASCFWEMARLRPDRAALAGLKDRARADEAIHQERFVAPQPRWVPEVAHETSLDMQLPAGWFRDEFAGRDETAAATGQFLIAYDQAEEDERWVQRQRQRRGRPVRRAIARWAGGAR